MGRELLSKVQDLSLDAMLGLTEVQRSGEMSDEVRETLYRLTNRLSEWGLEREETFSSNVFVPSVCCFVLAGRRIPDSAKWLPDAGRPQTHDVFVEISGEYQNLRKVVYWEEGADLERAKEFCLALNRMALAAGWADIHERRGLIA